ncbi:hypothetical protein BRC81_11320 [Halobacteriales archaeon QS_1_68_20]|nr:MAG: hypothetical protein BRC81_11320 [Halobacteriales archaeon QS_1_68_20]
MNRRFATVLGLAALALAAASFVLLGFGRMLVGYRTALVVAAPVGTLAFALGLGLAALAALGRVGVGPLAVEE